MPIHQNDLLDLDKHLDKLLRDDDLLDLDNLWDLDHPLDDLLLEDDFLDLDNLRDLNVLLDLDVIFFGDPGVRLK